MIRVMVNGAGGKMGREVVKAVHNDPELTLVGGIDPVSYTHLDVYKRQVSLWGYHSLQANI